MQDERSRIIRRTIVRYVCVAFTITLTLISPKAKKRFPSLKHFVETGLISREEMELMEEIDNEFPNYSKYWLPLAWASSVTTRARHEGTIKDDLSTYSILEEINRFRSKLGSLLDYDWISVPLVYTQVVTIAVYSYFLVTVIGNQFLPKYNSDVYIFSFPFLPILEFFFYMGWLKVAETLINPFGEDDDDFEVMWMIDRHIQVCYLLVDRIHHEHPKLEKDFYWDQIAPLCLPFTVAAQDYIEEYPQSSTTKLDVKNTEQDLIMPSNISELDSKGMKKGVSKLWTSNKVLFKRHSRENEIPLVQVGSTRDTKDGKALHYGSNNFNQTDTPLLDNHNNIENNEDFLNLYEERLKNRKVKLLKYLELMRSKEDQETIINDVLK